MKRKFISILLFLLFVSVFYNSSNGQITPLKGVNIKIEHSDINKLFIQIEKDIADSRVVFLGELNHGDGNVFEIKTELVKFFLFLRWAIMFSKLNNVEYE
jgi:hypothetical protein